LIHSADRALRPIAGTVERVLCHHDEKPGCQLFPKSSYHGHDSGCLQAVLNLGNVSRAANWSMRWSTRAT
jgi:hypothetical protein